MSILSQHISESDLDALYNWIDDLPLSRPKKYVENNHRNISRDFSDAMMMAETIAFYFPKIIDVHNYPATNSLKSKEENWKTLNQKVLSRLGINLRPDEIQKLAGSIPLAIESLLLEFKKLCPSARTQSHKERAPSNYPRYNENGYEEGQGESEFRRYPEDPETRKKTFSKIEELKEILKIMKDKIAFVEKNIKKKDAEIKELEDIAQLGV